MEIQQITVIGSGTMGRGIAHVCAAAGFDTILVDVEEARLNEAKSSIESNLRKGVEKQKISLLHDPGGSPRIRTTTELEAACRDANVIIEAVNEDLDLKKNIFAQADLFCAPDTLIATNTSSFSIRTLASNVERVVTTDCHPRRGPMPRVPIPLLLLALAALPGTARAQALTLADALRRA